MRYYERYWDLDDGWTPTHKMSPKLFCHILGHQFDRDSRILDVGCGDCSNYQSYFPNNCKEYVGIDVSREALERAKSRGFKVINADLAEDLPFEDNYFDLIVCIEVLEHLFDPKKVLNEANRVLKNSGRLVVSVPNVGYFRDRLVFLTRAYINNSPFDPDNPWAGAHIRFFSKRSLFRLLKNTGFKNIRMVSSMGNSIFDFFDVINPEISKPFRKLPGLLRMSFLGKIWPSMFLDHLIVIASK